MWEGAQTADAADLLLIGGARCTTLEGCLPCCTPSCASASSSHNSAVSLCVCVLPPHAVDEDRGRAALPQGGVERGRGAREVNAEDRVGNAGSAAAIAAGGASFGFKAAVEPGAAAFLSAHFIQHRSTAATQAETGGKRQPMMSSSRLHAPDATVCSGKTLNFETMWSTPVSTGMLQLSAPDSFSCVAVRFAHARTATRPPILTNNGVSAE